MPAKTRLLAILLVLINSLFQIQAQPNLHPLSKSSQKQYKIELIKPEDSPFGTRSINLLMDSQGFLWVGSAHGLFRYDGYNFEKIEIGEGNDLEFWFDRVVQSLDEDKKGNIWGWGNGGVFKIDPFTKSVYRPDVPIGNVSFSILVDDYEGIWLDEAAYIRYYNESELSPFDSIKYQAFDVDNSAKYPDSLYEYFLENISDTVVSIWKVKNNQHIQRAFTLNNNSKLTVVSMGEILSPEEIAAFNIADVPSNGKVDHSWICNIYGDTVWSSDRSKTMSAGGRLDNRIQVEIVDFSKGSYVLNYYTDFSHSYEKWEGPGPKYEEFWGAQIYLTSDSIRNLISFLNDSLLNSFGEIPFTYQSGSLIRDNNGNILIGAKNGLFEPFTLNGNIYFNQIERDNKESISLYSLLSSTKGPDGYILINGIISYKDQSKDFVLESFDPKTKKFKTIFKKRVDQKNTWREKIVYDSISQSIWQIGYLGKRGLFKWEYPYTNEPNFVQSLSKDISLDKLNLGELSIDSYQNLWIGTRTGDLLKLRTGDDNLRYLSLDGLVEKVEEISITTFAEDKLGRIWIGISDNHVLRYNPKEINIETVQVPLSDKSDNASYVFNDSKNRIWLNGTKGIHYYNDKTEDFDFYKIPAHDSLDYPENSQLIIKQELKDGKIWGQIYTQNKERVLLFFDPATKIFDIDNYIPNTSNSLVESNTLWTGQYNPSGFYGLIKISLDSIKQTQPRTVYGDRPIIINNIYHDLCKDKKGIIWAGTSVQGLAKIDPENGFLKWITVENGLLSNTVYDVLETPDGLLWIYTLRGISVFNPISEKITSPRFLDGIKGHGGLFLSSSGHIYVRVNNKNGFYIFHPDSLSINETPPKTLLSNLLINNKSVSVSDSSILEYVIAYTSQLSLAHNQNNFALEYRGLHFDDPEKNQYAYILEHAAEEWSYVGGEKIARFTDLKPGDYTFKVKSANADGIWSEPIQLNISISPPWYWNALSKILYLMVFVGLTYSFYRWRTKETRKRFIRERRLNIRLQKVDELKDQFLANTSHELRTPLNGIIGLAETLYDGVAGNLPIKAKKNLKMIILSGKRLSHLINDILDFSKLKNAELKLNKVGIDVYSLVDVVLRLCSPLAETKELKLINSVEKDLPPILADENRIQQILFNLIGNAIKFTDSGYVRINGSQLDEKISISVEDTGIGIPENKIKTIFDSFVQVEDSDSRQFSGTGLGLSVTKKLVELHGGTLDVISEVGTGSTFTICLDKADENEKIIIPDESMVLKEEEDEEEQLAKVIPAKESNGIRVLIVDDEPINLQVLNNQLTFQGYLVTEAHNGAEALEKIEKEEKFELLLLDIMMPKMSGYEVCEKLRELYLPNELPIVMVTAKSGISNIIEGFETGANDYLTKPFSKDELLSRIRMHLNLHNINKAMGKFVPGKFLKAIGRDSIMDVKLGDLVNQNVTVFFSDIRDFTHISESMKPEEIFAFINEYNKLSGPIIRKNNGFINQYQGDSIMAVFPASNDGALSASIQIQQALTKYNETAAVKCRSGIGLHTGQLVLGITGDGDRLDTTVIADTVNVTSRIENLTKYFGVKILVSESFKKSISNPKKFTFRYIGEVRLKGKTNQISIYECLEGENDEILSLKIKSLKKFNEGVNCFYNRKFPKASVLFEEVLEIYPEDKTAKYFLTETGSLIAGGITENWTGVKDISVV